MLFTREAAAEREGASGSCETLVLEHPTAKRDENPNSASRRKNRSGFIEGMITMLDIVRTVPSMVRFNRYSREVCIELLPHQLGSVEAQRSATAMPARIS